jgi:hypothetical protein
MKLNEIISETKSNKNEIEGEEEEDEEKESDSEILNSKNESNSLKNEFLNKVYENFIFFLKNFNRTKNQKNFLSRKTKIKKKVPKKKTFKMEKEGKSIPEIKDKTKSEIYEIFKDQLKQEEIEKIIEVMQINKCENISDIKNFPQHIKTLINLKKKENISNINTRNSESFLTYLKENGKRGYSDIPVNCTHIKICYFIWKCQGNSEKDPTAIGRKIKKMALFVN